MDAGRERPVISVKPRARKVASLPLVIVVVVVVVVNEQTVSGVDFDFTQAHLIGCFKLYDDESGIFRISALDADCWSCRRGVRLVMVKTTHRVAVRLRTLNQRVNVSDTDSYIRRHVPCITISK